MIAYNDRGIPGSNYMSRCQSRHGFWALWKASFEDVQRCCCASSTAWQYRVKLSIFLLFHMNLIVNSLSLGVLNPFSRWIIIKPVWNELVKYFYFHVVGCVYCMNCARYEGQVQLYTSSFRIKFDYRFTYSSWSLYKKSLNNFRFKQPNAAT